MATLLSLPAETLEHIAEDVDDRKALIALSCSSRRLRPIVSGVIFQDFVLTCVSGEIHPFVTATSFLKEHPRIAFHVKRLSIAGYTHISGRRLREPPTINLTLIASILPLVLRVRSLALCSVVWTIYTGTNRPFGGLSTDTGRNIKWLKLDGLRGIWGTQGALSLLGLLPITSLTMRNCSWQHGSTQPYTPITLPRSLIIRGREEPFLSLADTALSTPTSLTVHNVAGNTSYCTWLKAVIHGFRDTIEELHIWVDNTGILDTVGHSGNIAISEAPHLRCVSIGLRFPPTSVLPQHVANFRWRFVPVVARGLPLSTTEFTVVIDLRHLSDHTWGGLHFNVLRWEEMVEALHGKAVKHVKIIVRQNSLVGLADRIGNEETTLLKGRLRAQGLAGSISIEIQTLLG